MINPEKHPHYAVCHWFKKMHPSIPIQLHESKGIVEIPGVGSFPLDMLYDSGIEDSQERVLDAVEMLDVFVSFSQGLHKF